MRSSILGVSLLTALLVPIASAEQIAITGFRQPQVQLFDVQGLQPVDSRASASIPLPLPIRELLPNGVYVVDVGEESYSIKKRAVTTNRVYELNSKCNNTVAARHVAASRGIGEGCE